MNAWRALLAAALAVHLLAGAQPPREARPLADDPVVEARLVAIAAELRCLVCQNESLAESRAPLALDLRREIRERIGQGASDSEVREFLVARYGDFVLYRPPVTPRTWALWAGPFVLLAVAAAVLAAAVRRGASRGAALSPQEQRELDALLASDAPREERR